MEVDLAYELVYDAVRQALLDADGGDARLLRRFEGGRVVFEDNQGKAVKEIPAATVFKKVTSVREKLRVLEQKLNNHDRLSDADKAEVQRLITRCYGSLTTFNFLFADDAAKFHGTGE
jgi:hypothetical protein